MKKTLIITMSILTTIPIVPMEQKTINSKSSKKTITDFIFHALRKSKPKNWCMFLPSGQACHPAFKEYLTYPFSLHHHGNYRVQSISKCTFYYDRELQHYADEMDHELSYQDNIRSPEYGHPRILYSSIVILGKNKIEEFDQKFGSSIDSKDCRDGYVGIADSHTRCYRKIAELPSGIPQCRYTCRTNISREEFLKRMLKKSI